MKSFGELGLADKPGVSFSPMERKNFVDLMFLGFLLGEKKA